MGFRNTATPYLDDFCFKFFIIDCGFQQSNRKDLQKKITRYKFSSLRNSTKLTKWFNYSSIMVFFRQVHNDYKNGRQNRFDQIKRIFYYKSNLIWSNQGKGLTMETFHKDDGYSLHTLESNLKLDTQVLSMSLPSNSNHEIYWYFLIVKSMVSLKCKKK